MRNLLNPAVLLQSCLADAPVALAVLDNEMNFLAATALYQQYRGLAGQDLTGRNAYDLLHDIPGHWRAAHLRALAGAQEGGEGDAMVRPDGTVGYWSWQMAPWRGPDGKIGGVTVVVRDAAGDIEQKQQLRRYADGLESANVGIGIVDVLTDRLIYANPELAAQFRMNPADMRGMPILETFPSADRARMRGLQDIAGAKGSTRFESERLRSDGTTFTALTAITSISKNGDVPAYRVGTVMDLTDLKKSEGDRMAAQDELFALMHLGPGVLCRKRVTHDDIRFLETRGDLMRLARPGESAAEIETLIAVVLKSPETANLLHRLESEPDVQSGSVDVQVSQDGQDSRWIRNAMRVTSRSGGAAEMVGYLTDVSREM